LPCARGDAPADRDQDQDHSPSHVLPGQRTDDLEPQR